MPTVMGALRERLREVPITLADQHKTYDDQCKKEQREITPVVERVNTTSASPSDGGAAGAMYETWPGPFMDNPATGKQYEERDLWALAEELVNLAIGHLGLTGSDDWSEMPRAGTHRQWSPAQWSGYHGAD